MKFQEKFFDVELLFHENGSLMTKTLINEPHQNDKKKKTKGESALKGALKLILLWKFFYTSSFKISNLKFKYLFYNNISSAVFRGGK